MGRLPFDPGKMRGRERSQAEPAKRTRSSKPGDQILTVSRLASLVSRALDEHLPKTVRVVGEISSARRSTHLYFQMKDAGAVLSAVIFANRLRALGFEPRDGQEVVATGRVEFYEPQGRVSLIVERIEPVGEGAAEIRFRQLCEEIKKLGWFAPERKRTLPTFPRRVGVVTSATGAALQDVLTTMAKRCPAVDVMVVPVRVQGDAAAREVVRAIEFVSRDHGRLGIDALIVTRGGGSKEDLAAFNEREVARAIVECELPVVAAIGHETDTTIAELVADERCATPTQAAMRLTPDREALARQVDTLARRFATDLARTLRFERQRLASAARHPVLADPRGATRLATEQLATARDDLQQAGFDAVADARARALRALDRLTSLDPKTALSRAAERTGTCRRDLDRGVRHTLERRRQRLDALHATLEAIGPKSVLNRGYSYTLGPDGRLVRSASSLTPGDRLNTQFADGTVESEVVGPSDPKPTRSRSRNRAQPRPGHGVQPDADPRDQLDLFSGEE